jgi:hypothetical protein
MHRVQEDGEGREIGQPSLTKVCELLGGGFHQVLRDRTGGHAKSLRRANDCLPIAPCRQTAQGLSQQLFRKPLALPQGLVSLGADLPACSPQARPLHGYFLASQQNRPGL